MSPIEGASWRDSVGGALRPEAVKTGSYMDVPAPPPGLDMPVALAAKVPHELNCLLLKYLSECNCSGDCPLQSPSQNYQKDCQASWTTAQTLAASPAKIPLASILKGWAADLDRKAVDEKALGSLSDAVDASGCVWQLPVDEKALGSLSDAVDTSGCVWQLPVDEKALGSLSDAVDASGCVWQLPVDEKALGSLSDAVDTSGCVWKLPVDEKALGSLSDAVDTSGCVWKLPEPRVDAGDGQDGPKEEEIALLPQSLHHTLGWKPAKGKGKAKSSNGGSHQDSRWWTRPQSPLLCPLTKFPIALLPYPPFKLRADPAGSSNSHKLVDGKYLAMKFIVNGSVLECGRDLDASDITALNDYIHRCKLGPFKPGRAIALAREAITAESQGQRKRAEKDLACFRASARLELGKLRRIQENRLFQAAQPSW